MQKKMISFIASLLHLPSQEKCLPQAAPQHSPIKKNLQLKRISIYEWQKSRFVSEYYLIQARLSLKINHFSIHNNTYIIESFIFASDKV